MSPGSSKRPTGTVPKSKPTSKNVVPQEMVAPTRRDLQEHLNEFFASVAERTSKPENNRTRTPGENCFEFDNLGLQENTRFCWPVRPIPRRNFLHEDMNDLHTTAPNATGSNAAIGVVIPTTPNSSLHQQIHDNIPHTYTLNHHTRTNQTPDSMGESAMRANDSAHQTNGPNVNVEDRLNQIQEYIRITSTLINSIQTEKSNQGNSEDLSTLTKNLENLKDSEEKLLHLTNIARQVSDQSVISNGDILINSNMLENVHSSNEPHAPRPQSVTSINASAPNTPTYDELQTKLEASNRNMLHIKEQQQQLLRLQQAAKQQLQDMEHIRVQHGPLSFNNQNGLPDYDNAEDVQNDVTALMNRMKSLTDFIHNQNELASLLGEDKGEVLEEQIQLQRKLNELKNKKQEMANFVNELQNINGEVKQNYGVQDRNQTPMRNVPIDYERIVPIELVQNSRNTTQTPVSNKRYAAPPIVNKNPEPIPEPEPTLEEEEEEEGAAVSENDDIINTKIAEINAMKSQLKRLKDMMDTVKLIEIKNGDRDADTNSARTSRSQSHFESLSDNYNHVPTNQIQQLKSNTNMIESIEQPQRDDEEQMDERVRALHSMTQDLRLQAISLAAEHDRLKDIKNEMHRRREIDGNDKNINQNREINLEHKSQEEELIKSEYEAKKKEFEKLVEKLDSGNESIQSKVDKKDKTETIYYPENWRHNASSSSSQRSAQGRQSEPSSKPNLSSGNQGKDSADSGAADVLGMSADAGSLQSGSSRGFSVPPPMRNISGRDAPGWRKTSQETSRISSINQPNTNFDIQHEHYPSWYYHNNYYNQGYNMGPQSPHCHYHHHMGNDQIYCRSMYHPNMPPIAGTTNNDPMLLQQFIQTQQMLINSVCQCNQLLWDQQREINNLNSAVLLLQERILNNANNESTQAVRAESVPPNVTCTNTQAFLPRAQSEQPLSNHSGCFQTVQGYSQQNSPFRQYPFSCQNHAQIYRNSQANNNANNNRVMRFTNTNAQSLPIINQRAELPLNYYQNEIVNNTVASSQQQSNPLIFPNNYINPQMHIQPPPSSSQPPPALLNNDLNSPLLNTPQCQTSVSPIFIHHNNNTAANNNANINNQLHQQSVAVAASTTTSSSAFSPPVPPALNNQVPPGNRANNYWDNFRSYSRQNLLSSNSCKSNEDACSSSNSPHNRDQNYQATRNPPPTQMTHNNLPPIGNKYLVHFRNQINQQQNTIAPPDVLNINQHQQQHNENSSENVNNFNNLNISAVAPVNQQAVGQSSGNFNINAINLELNELKPNTTKMLPKGATGGNKRIRQIREREQNNLSVNQASGGVDLNLASTVNRQDSKSSAKLFEALKENVYLEVSALIAANESRPHFLINLFRELQLISSSDPLRNRLMQAFQELYNRYCEPTIQEESSSQSVQNDATPENPQHDSTQSSDNRFNQSVNSVDFPSADSTPVRIPDLHASIDEDVLRSVMIEVAEFLLGIDQINECTLQRITNIALRHLNSPSNKPTINVNKYLISHDEFLRNLHNLDRRNREIFLEGLENYLSTVFLTSASAQNGIEDELYQRRPECFLDMAPPVPCKSNEVLSALRKKEECVTHNTITLADVVAVIGHVPMDDNEDLAEADQICNTDEMYSAEDDFNNRSDGGAVGGVASSTLPDLAKVTATPTNNSLEEESAWMANEEVERITSQSNGNDSLSNINSHSDNKQKNQ